MRPIVHGLEAEYWGRIDFIYLDIDNAANLDVMQRYGFTSQPLFVLVEADGTEVQRWYGYVQASDLRAAFDALLASGD